jgi:alpha-tubulin suppressor-like RCC1 family protein
VRPEMRKLMGEYKKDARSTRRSMTRTLGIATVLGAVAAAALTPLAASAAPSPDAGPTIGGATVSDTVAGVRFTSVSADLGPSYALGDDGNAYAWGLNSMGQLGDGTTTNRLTPVRVAAPAGVTFTELSGGEGFAIALDPNGQAYSWGQGPYGQLGDGDTQSRIAPVAVQMPAGVTFTDVDAGSYHALAVGSDGLVYGWGYNGHGRVGDGTTVQRTAPVQVATPAGVTFTTVEAGNTYSLALASDGSIYAWGMNYAGTLGDGSQTDRATPALVQMPAGVTFTQISAGNAHSLALASTGEVYAWGLNYGGPIGNGDISGNHVLTPVVSAFPAGASITQISAGAEYSLALDGSGQLYTWGKNTYGMLASGSITGRYVPGLAQLPDGVAFTSIDAGSQYALATGSNGKTYGWGTNSIGALGDGTMQTRFSPTLVRTEVTVTDVTFDGVPGTDLVQDDGAWTATTPAYCGPSDVAVSYTQFGVASSIVFDDGYVFGSAPTITESPTPSVVVAGQAATLTAAADGDDAPTVQWQQALTPGGPWEEIEGETSTSITVNPDATTYYRAVFTNCAGQAITEQAIISLRASTGEPGTDDPGTEEPGTDEPGTDTPGTDEPETPDAETPASGGNSAPGESSGSSTTSADATLALTGGSVPWIPIVVGGGLLLVGAAGILLRGRRLV